MLAFRIAVDTQKGGAGAAGSLLTVRMGSNDAQNDLVSCLARPDFKKLASGGGGKKYCCLDDLCAKIQTKWNAK